MNALLVALIVVSLSVVASPAQAASSAVCIADMPFTLEPGATMTPGTFAFSTHGPNGTIDCSGSVNGQFVIGQGRFTNEGVINGTCTQGTGRGHFLAQIPTSGGLVAVSGDYTFQYIGLTGTFLGPNFSGAFQFVPVTGDCVAAALTRVVLLAQGLMTT
jgi:hypothetical protein